MTRIGQQAWKEEVEVEDEDDDSKQNKPKGSKKGKGKGRKRGKGNKGKGRKGKADAKPKASPKKKGRKPRKSQTPKTSTEDALVTPPPKAEKTERSGSKRKGGQSLGEEPKPTKQKKTFARRYRSCTKEGGMLWDALLNAFVSIISIRVKAPSRMEAIMKSIMQNKLKSRFELCYVQCLFP